MAETPNTKIQRFYGKNRQKLDGYEYQDMGYWKEYPSVNSTARTKLTSFNNALKGITELRDLSHSWYWKITDTTVLQEE